MYFNPTTLLKGLFCILLMAFGHIASAEYFVIDQFDVKMTVDRSGYFTVKETIDVTFSEERHGIYRQIPYIYRVDGKEYKIQVSDIAVEGDHFETSKSGRNLIIKIGSANTYVNGKKQYIISYRVKKAFLFLENHTEFYWNVLGDEWPVPINAVTFDVDLGNFIVLQPNDYRVFAGASGSQDSSAVVQYNRNHLSGHTNRPFAPQEGLTMAIKFPKEYITRPTATEIWWEKYGLTSVGFGFFAFLSMFFYGIWNKYGKDYPIIRAVQFSPPKDLTPSEAGTIIDERADNVDVLALIPYWANKGYIQIKQIKNTWSKDDHQLIKLKDLADDAPSYEKTVFYGIFNYGNDVLISDLQDKFYDKLAIAKSQLKAHLNSKDIYYPISMKYQIVLGVLSGLCVAIGIILFFIFQSFGLSLFFGLAALLGFILTNFMLKKNANGVRLYQETLGFKMFIKAAEKDKLERMLKDDPMYFEKTLPYAMVFGYTKSWAKKFDGLLTQPPSWYIGPNYGASFHPSDFGQTFDNSMDDIKSVFTSTPSSSGGGGGFSGGSVGGGFGGGGGGSW